MDTRKPTSTTEAQGSGTTTLGDRLGGNGVVPPLATCITTQVNNMNRDATKSTKIRVRISSFILVPVSPCLAQSRCLTQGPLTLSAQPRQSARFAVASGGSLSRSQPG